MTHERKLLACIFRVSGKHGQDRAERGRCSSRSLTLFTNHGKSEIDNPIIESESGRRYACQGNDAGKECGVTRTENAAQVPDLFRAELPHEDVVFGGWAGMRELRGPCERLAKTAAPTREANPPALSHLTE